MSPSLKQKMDTLNAEMVEIIELVKNLPPELRSAPVGKSFSPIAMLEHMAIVEEIYVEQLNKCEGKQTNFRTTKPGFMFNMLLKMMDRPVGKMTPTPKNMMPSSSTTLEQGAERWISARTTITEFLTQFDDTTGAFKEPFIGWMNPQNFYDMMVIHQKYHRARLPQVR